jgi:hypothetical protein
VFFACAGAASFRKTDVTRLIKAAIDAGIPNPVVRINPKTKEMTVSAGPSEPNQDGHS